MSKLDFIRSSRADDADWELYLEELVVFMPADLQPNINEWFWHYS